MTSFDDGAVRTWVEEVEAQLDALAALEPSARELALGAVQGVLALYGEALARIVMRLEEAGHGEVGGGGSAGRLGEAGANGEVDERGGAYSVVDPIAILLDDELVAHLLILHDLHPVDLTTRVEQALAEVRPYLQSRGGDAELARIDAEGIQLRLSGRAKDVTTLQETVETAVRRAAPEIEMVIAGDTVAPAHLVQIGGRRE